VADIIPFRPANRHVLATPEGEPGEFVAILAELTHQWAERRRTSRAGLVADVIAIGSGRLVRDMEGRPMSEFKPALVRLGAAIVEWERQQRAAEEKPET